MHTLEVWLLIDLKYMPLEMVFIIHILEKDKNQLKLHFGKAQFGVKKII
jgi:hypothetical protein